MNKIDKRKWWQCSLIFGYDGKLSESSIVLLLASLFDIIYLIFDLIGKHELEYQHIFILSVITIIAYVNKEGSRKSWAKWFNEVKDINISTSGISITRDTEDEDEDNKR